jgi:tetratricopeptide (TPR) repeat protein
MPEPRSRSELPRFVAEGLLAAALVFAPLALGTVQWWSLAIVLGLTTAAALAAAVARPRDVPKVFWAALGMALFVGLQAVPLPPWIGRILSPHGALLGGESAGEWRPLSLDPPATLREMARLTAYVAAFFAASRVCAEGRAARRLARVIAAGALLQGVFIAAHKAVATGQIYGVVGVTQGSTLLGTFGNSNHLAAYLALTVPVCVAVALQAPDVNQRRLWGLVAAAVSAAVVVTLSRSGIAGLAAALVAVWVAVRRDGAERAVEMKRWLALIGGLVLVAGLGAALFGGSHALDKLGSFGSPARVFRETKVQTWLDVPAMVRDFWLTGIGRGAFEAVYPSYKHVAVRLTFSHAECAPLQVLVDLGVPLGVAVLAAWAWGLRRGMRDERLLSRMAAAALIGLTVHELGDFAADTGGVGVTAAVVWGMVLPAGASVRAAVRWRRLGAVAAAAAVAAVALWAARRGDLRADLEALQRLQVDPHGWAQFQGRVQEARRRHPVEPWFPLAYGEELVRHGQAQAALRPLNRALELDPTGWKTHVVVGEALEQLGRRSQALIEYRLAYQGSQLNEYVLRVALAHPLSAEDLARLGGDDVQALDRIGGWLERNGRAGDAAAVAAHAIEVRADDAPARAILARRALAAGDAAGALGQLAPAGAAEEVVLLRAEALDKLGRSDEADGVLKAMLAASPSQGAAFALAQRLLDRRHFGDVLAVLARVPQRALGPSDLARYHRLHGLAFEGQGKTRDALLELATAARIDPSLANRMELGDAYRRAGLPRSALLEYRTAARATATPPPALQERMRALEARLSGTTISGEGGGEEPADPFAADDRGGGEEEE